MVIEKQVLKRQHINEALNHIFHYPLTVVVAAMGYGKTTSIKEYLNDVSTKSIWLTVDSDETSPQYIWDQLTRQMASVEPELGMRLGKVGFPSDVQQREMVLGMIEDSTYLTNTVLVIDDYHYARSPELDRLIERIVRNSIDGLHLLIISRTLPDLQIDELALKGFCHVIKSPIFEWHTDEIKAFFRLYDLVISDEIASEVYKLSEGWVSAIYLLMRRYAEIGTLEPSQSIRRLIESAVMMHYEEHEVKLLKSLSLLDHFTPEQAVYVTNDKTAGKIIHRLSYENSFIRYDKQHNTYRIHNIFNSYLLEALEEEPLDICRESIYERAGQWCVLHGNTITALRYFATTGRYDLMMAEFEKAGINKIFDNHSQTILELFATIPEEVKYQYPMGYLAYAGFYVTNVDKEQGDQLLSDISKYYASDFQQSSPEDQRIMGEIELIKAYAAFNDASQMKERLKNAFNLLKGPSTIANEDKIVTFGSPHGLYLYYREKGAFESTKTVVQEAFSYYTELAAGCGKGFEHLLHSEYDLETGDLKGAEVNAQKAIHKAETLHQMEVIICAYFVLSRVYAARGDFDKAKDIMNDLRHEVMECGGTILSSAFDLCNGYIGGITGREECFANWIKLGHMEHSEVLYQGMGFNYIIYGKYLLLQKEYIKLAVLCEEMRSIFSIFQNMLGMIHTSILEALSKGYVEGMEGAKKALLPALEIGKTDGICLPFIEYGRPMLDILKAMMKESDSVYTDYIQDLVDQTEDSMKHIQNKQERKDIVFDFTSREKDILTLILQGKTNRQIAAELFIAEVTVRKNITVIYRKLKVTGRAAAVKKIMDLKILTS